MKITFIGQGFESESKDAVGNFLLKFLSEKKFYSFTGISAFASKAGVLAFAEQIGRARRTYKSLNLIVGVDQQGTSKEALEAIQELDINSYIFYQRESVIFHPKIYLFEGPEEVKLIIGSSNFTGRGLFANVESSLLVEFSASDQNGIELIQKLKTYFKGLFDFSDPNLFKISTEAIQFFVDSGIVLTEQVTRKKYAKDTPSKNVASKSSVIIPARKQATIPKILKGKSQTNRVVTEIINELDADNNQEIPQDNLLLLWDSGPLSERDLNIPTGNNTNATGSMYFKKGKTSGIDQRHYFRDSVFANLLWTNARRNNIYLQKTKAFFRLIILGENRGEFQLTIRHNSNTESATYLQNNSVTSLSWGRAKEIIADRRLLGKSAKLYKYPEMNDKFLLSIE